MEFIKFEPLKLIFFMVENTMIPSHPVPRDWMKDQSLWFAPNQ